MFISNIISKLPAIIYKPGIIYKAITTPINKDQHPRSTNINTSSIEPLYTTCSHTQHTATSFSHYRPNLQLWSSLERWFYWGFPSGNALIILLQSLVIPFMNIEICMNWLYPWQGQLLRRALYLPHASNSELVFL